MGTSSRAYKQHLLQIISDAYEKGAIASTDESSVYVPAARNIRDQRAQAVRYRDVISGYASIQGASKEQDLGEVFGGVGEKVSSALENVASSVDSTVGRVGKSVGDRLDHIASFGTAKSDIHGTVLGAEIKNTITTMLGQDNLGDALKTLLADCIPCDGRVTAGFEVNILGNFKDQIELDIINRVNYLKGMLKFSSNKDIYNDMCSLVKSLNFMCVPDLIRILSLLSFLLSRYSIKIGDLSAILMGLVKGMFGPIMIDLQGLLDQYMQLILNVVDCIIDSLRYTMQTLGKQAGGVEEGKEKVKGAYDQFKDDWSSLSGLKYTAANPDIKRGEVDEYRDRDRAQKKVANKKRQNEEPVQYGPPEQTATDRMKSFAQGADQKLEGIGETVGTALAEVVGMVEEGRDAFESLMEMVEQQVASFSGEWFIKTGEGVGFLEAKLKIVRVIGLIKALIEFKSLGDICDGKDFPAEELSVFVNTYINPISTINIIADETSVTLADEDADAIKSIVDSVTGIELAQQEHARALGVTDTSQEIKSLDLTDIAAPITISFEDCLYGAEGADSKKVEQWIKELTNA